MKNAIQSAFAPRVGANTDTKNQNFLPLLRRGIASSATRRVGIYQISLLILLMFAFTIFAPGKIFGQCEPALPCVTGSINDYQCITFGTSPDLELSGKLLPYPGIASTKEQKLIVVNYIEFTDTYEFAPGTEIIMLPNSLLYIHSSVRFLDQVTIKGCGGSWYGIQVNDDGYLSLYNCTVSNSCEGIILESGSEAEIVSNNFTDNFMCIQAEGTVTLYGDGIAHNIFDGTTNTNSGCTQIVDRAIRLDNVPHITIGDLAQTGQPNEIIGYQHGIAAFNTGIDIVNTVFRDRPVGGTAIRLEGTNGVFNANITGLGGHLQARFL